MFGDYMNLLRVALQQKHTGPVMTGGHCCQRCTLQAVLELGCLCPAEPACIDATPTTPVLPHCTAGNGAPYQSGRVAYSFGLQGPCNGIDTACSSSLVAAHNAHRGESALCGDVQPGMLVGFHEQGMLHSFSHCMLPLPSPAGILGGEAAAAVAAGINVMVWHETTVGICQLQASYLGSKLPCFVSPSCMRPASQRAARAVNRCEPPFSMPCCRHCPQWGAASRLTLLPTATVEARALPPSC